MKYLTSKPVDKSWAYSDKTQVNTMHSTHSYYTYPAKFIPQIAERLIKENSDEGDIVADPFMGSGTTILEALINGRKAIGVDVNRIAFLLTKVKTTPLSESKLVNELAHIDFDLNHRMNGFFDFYSVRARKVIPENPRIDYWFTSGQKQKLSVILKRIHEIESINYREFFLVAFAQILKSCSRWLQSSVKPQRDPEKKRRDPLELFINQSSRMIRQNSELVKIIGLENLSSFVKNRKLRASDCRDLPCKNAYVDLIVTSPPYVTSYEYADLHQLPTLWFQYADQMIDFRKRFIGSALRERENREVMSPLAEKIVKNLKPLSKAMDVQYYFADMVESFIEMKRVLRKDGRLCVVIGNTKLRGVNIRNAEVFCEQLDHLDFRIRDVIRREISSKMLPSLRDPETGRFAHPKSKQKVLIHPEEYIIIAEKKQVI